MRLKINVIEIQLIENYENISLIIERPKFEQSQLERSEIRQDVRIFAPQDFSPFLEKNYPNPLG